MATYRLAPPSCRADWDVYHRIRQEVLLESLKYAMEQPDEEDEPGHHPLLFWKDDQPIGTIASMSWTVARRRSGWSRSTPRSRAKATAPRF